VPCGPSSTRADRTDRANHGSSSPGCPSSRRSRSLHPRPSPTTNSRSRSTLRPASCGVSRSPPARTGATTGATVRVAVDAGVADAASSARILDDLAGILTGTLADDLPGRSRTRDHTVAGTGALVAVRGAGTPAPWRPPPSGPTTHPCPDTPDALARLTDALLGDGRGRRCRDRPAGNRRPRRPAHPRAARPVRPRVLHPVRPPRSVRSAPSVTSPHSRAPAQASARTALLHAKEHRARTDAATTTGSTAGTGTDGDVEGGATPPPAVTVTCGDTRMVPHGHAAACPLLTVGRHRTRAHHGS
jgi:hypothetical protein